MFNVKTKNKNERMQCGIFFLKKIIYTAMRNIIIINKK